MIEKVQLHPDISTEVKTVRSSVSANDSANPTVGTGKNFVGYSWIKVEITLTGTSPVASITPLVLSKDGTTYLSGETLSLTSAGSFAYDLRVDSNSDVNFKITGLGGTSPVVTISAYGVN